MTSMPRRETMRYIKPKESDTDRAHRLLGEIVRDHGQGDRYRFTQALIVRLHAMRLSPAVLLTSEGVDAVIAVATALDDWRELEPTRARTLPKVWLNALHAVAGRPTAASFHPRTSFTTSRFTNNIKIR